MKACKNCLYFYWISVVDGVCELSGDYVTFSDYCDSFFEQPSVEDLATDTEYEDVPF